VITVTRRIRLIAHNPRCVISSGASSIAIDDIGRGRRA